jgi:hypothetical protein
MWLTMSLLMMIEKPAMNGEWPTMNWKWPTTMMMRMMMKTKP